MKYGKTNFYIAFNKGYNQMKTAHKNVYNGAS